MADMDDALYAPGRRRLKRRGRIDVYWVADKRAVQAGFTPKTVHLKDDPGGETATAEIAFLCRRLWAEMHAFMGGKDERGTRFRVGTIGWLADYYQSDPDSRYHRIRPSTRTGYDRTLEILRETVGGRSLNSVTSGLLSRWHREWGREDERGKLTNPRRAYGCIQLMRIIVRFGRGMRLAGCRDLAEILEMEFDAPRGRRVAMTAVQAREICAKAHEMGSTSIARAVAVQFGCALRQKDVIGEWVGGQWSGGLLWGEHVKADWTLVKPTSKTNFREIAEFDLRLIPPALAELQDVPATSRIGPVVLCETTGRPWRQRAFAKRFRDIARAAGVPDGVWNMDARAGAITDARRFAATREDSMALGTHTQASTNARYDRDRMAATSRVAVLRFGRKDEK